MGLWEGRRPWGQPCLEAPPPSLTLAWARGQSLMPPTLQTSPEQGRAELLQIAPSDSAQMGAAPQPGPGLLAAERWQPKQGLGNYLKAEMASMACCRTAVRR